MRRIGSRFLLPLIVLAATAALASASREWPVDGGTITSGIGWRSDPFGSGRQLYHHGIDIAVPAGTPVFPTTDGRVIFTGPYGGYGNTVVVDHGNGLVSIYGHNGEIRARYGERVTTRSVIALSGSTGRSTGPHVHYEVRQLAGNSKARRAQVIALMKEAVEENLDQIVQNAVEKGVLEQVLSLPVEKGKP
jgi:murein DD-endopeptidase MepM/ murein hydrolase activator NlpD